MGGERLARGLSAAGFALALTLAGCSPAAEAGRVDAQARSSEAAASAHPISGLKVIPLTVSSDGKAHRFAVELADTPEAQQKGLMFRTELGPDEGMIFPSEPPAPRSFWMKNTPLPLDIIFIGADRHILNIAAETPPYTLDSVTSNGITSGVLELRGGRAAELGIKPGDRVEW